VAALVAVPVALSAALPASAQPLAGVTFAQSQPQPPSRGDQTDVADRADRADPDSVHDSCGLPGAGAMYCHAKLRYRAGGGPHASSTPVGGAYGPADLRSAYALPAPAGAPGSGPTVAIVDAFDNPNAESDLAAYRTQYALGDCTTANGCFSKVNQRGQVIGGAVAPPAGNVGWGQEIDLDVEMVSAVCPQCKILLVESDDNYFANLGAAVDRAAATPGVVAVSNSYGGGEFSGETGAAYNGHYNHPGIALTVSSGDSGYGVQFPAASQYVTSVGGTSLTRAPATSRGWSETAWSGAGSGCSAYLPKPTWQPNVNGCTHRMVSDVSAVADPYTGVGVYDTYGSTGGLNWYVFGGTSVASPIVATVYALAGNTGRSDILKYPYDHRTSLVDVTRGSNGRCSRTPQLCTAGTGWDGPTGLGTPNGTAAF